MFSKAHDDTARDPYFQAASEIALPQVSYVRHNPLSMRARPEPALIDKSPIEDPLCELQPLEIEQVRRTAQEPLFNSLMEEHHYLGYEQPVGEHLDLTNVSSQLQQWFDYSGAVDPLSMISQKNDE